MTWLQENVGSSMDDKWITSNSNLGSWIWPKRAGWEGKTFLDSKILNTVWDFSYGWKSMLLGKNFAFLMLG